jgi:hypothetical protein
LTVSTILDRRDTGAMRFGLCDTCVHQQIVRNTRGSVFSLCRRSRDQPEFPRYPRVPVLSCPGHEPRASTDDAPDPEGPEPSARS